MRRTISRLFLIAVLTVTACFVAATGHADEVVTARVNGKALTDADVKLAEAEIGSDLGSLAGVPRRRVLIEFLIETQLLAEAAQAQKLSPRPGKADNQDYWVRRGLRDAYFEEVIAKSVDDGEVKAFYDEHVARKQVEEEVRARHILVESKAKAQELHQKLLQGADFAELARQNTEDPGSKDQGGDLGFFVKGQMVPPFEEAAFALKPGEVSQPFETQFGWHIVKLDARRERKAPSFEQIKTRLKAAVIHFKAQQIVLDLRSKAKIEYVDADVRKLVESEQQTGKN